MNYLLSYSELGILLGFGNVEWSSYYSDLLNGVLVTLEYTVASYIGALLLAAIIALMRTSSSVLAKTISSIFVEILKNLPLLTWLFILYYGLTRLDIVLSTFAAGSIALSTFYAAYLSEIFRSSIEGVHKGQKEAAQALGLSTSQTILQIVLPQAVRLALPGTATMLVDLLKGTSLLVTIAGAELMTQGQIITATTFESLEVYSVIGLIYFALCYPTSQIVLWLERSLRIGKPLTLSRRALFKKVRILQEHQTKI